MDVVAISDPPEERCDHGPSHEIEPPLMLVVPQSEKRLDPHLRAAAETHDPDEILVRATVRAYSGALDLARALADLAATGSAAARHLADGLRPPQELAALAARRMPGVAANDALLLSHAIRTRDRALRVAELLRGDAAERARLRRLHPELEGWIAVSGEDDPPHTPVNVPFSPHATHRELIEVGGHALPVRYVWAGPDTGGALIVLVHGHSSKLEEYDHLVGELMAFEDERGRPRYRVAVPDLPSCGYSGRIDHEDIAPSTESGAPLLRFLERFTEAFVRHVCVTRGRPVRAAMIAGGSLGGNIALRLAERDHPLTERLGAWSAASVWSSMEGDLIKGCALTRTRERMIEEEEDESRRRYFREVFADAICGAGRTQPEMWYRDGWACRPAYINRTIWDRREVYDPQFRRWHWRVAHEQLRFSHVQNRNGKLPWQSIRGPLALMAGSEDNHTWTHIHDRTRELALRLHGVPGTCVLFARTGHSIHDERPRLLASHLDRFLRSS